jgi:formylglycine-generating enzyme required for sulfatase activity
LEATGHKQPEHWKDRKPPSGQEDHPVVWVSWHDAVAYCNWLSEVTGRPYGLPSEAEWEKGARGTDGRIYPWGNQWDAERCNTGESGKGDTTPVGAYPQGASPYGLVDMAGNVWEWTRSLWGEDAQEPSFKYPYDPADGREDLEAPDTVRRVLRGGSWYLSRDRARCVGRNGDGPDYSDDAVGFRLVSPVGSDF